MNCVTDMGVPIPLPFRIHDRLIASGQWRAFAHPESGQLHVILKLHAVEQACAESGVAAIERLAYRQWRHERPECFRSLQLVRPATKRATRRQSQASRRIES